MDTITYQLRAQVPVIAEADILVVGLGPGGLCAAVTAARCGLKVVAAEHYGAPGGMAFHGEISPFMPNHEHDRPLDQPLYLEWINRMRAYLVDRPPTANNFKAPDERYIAKVPAMLAAEDMLLEAGVQLFYHHTFFDAVLNDGRIESVIFSGKSGLSAIRAKMVIDSTGDGDVAAKCGCAFGFGNEEGYCQPMTLCFKLSHVDKSRIPPRPELQKLYVAAQQDGRISCVRENILYFDDFDDDVIHFNTTRIIQHSGTNAESLSDAEIIGRRQMREFLAFLRASVPGFERAELHSVATVIGVRESRRITGIAALTVDAFDKAAKFDDAIARVNYPVDIHNPNGTGTCIRTLPGGEYYEIPYGCIVPPKPENLLIGGRCISVDHALHSSMRVMPPVCSIGQAAGTAAAMAIESGKTPAELDGREVRAELRKFGAYL